MSEMFSSSLSECPYCHAILSYVGDKCQYCGKDLTQYKSSDIEVNQSKVSIGRDSGLNTCPTCGYIFTSEETECPICKYSLNNNRDVVKKEQYNVEKQDIDIPQRSTGTFKPTPQPIEKTQIAEYNYSYTNDKPKTKSFSVGFSGSIDDTPTSKPNNVRTSTYRYNRQTYRSTYETSTHKTAPKSKGKIPLPLKIFLIVIGIQFLFPVFSFFFMIIGALVQIDNAQDQLKAIDTPTGQVQTIEELDLYELKVKTGLDEDEDVFEVDENLDQHIMETQDHLMVVRMNNNNGSASGYVCFEREDIELARMDRADLLTLIYDDHSIQMKIYPTGQDYSHPLEPSQIAEQTLKNAKRMDDIQLGDNSFRCYKILDTWYYITCEIDGGTYFSYAINSDKALTDMDDIIDCFHLEALDMAYHGDNG